MFEFIVLDQTHQMDVPWKKIHVVSECVGSNITVFSVMEVALWGLHHGNRGSIEILY